MVGRGPDGRDSLKIPRRRFARVHPRTLLTLAFVAALGYGGLFAARALDDALLPRSAAECPDLLRGVVRVAPDGASFPRGRYLDFSLEVENPRIENLTGLFGSFRLVLYHVEFDGRLRSVLGQSTDADFAADAQPTVLAQGERAWLGSFGWDGLLRPGGTPAPGGEYLVKVEAGPGICGVGRFVLREA